MKCTHGYSEMSKKAKKVAVAATIFVVALSNLPIAHAEEQEQEPQETPVVVVIEVIPTPTPVPPPAPTKPIWDQPIEHNLNYDEVSLLARLTWSSPLRSTRYKRAFIWSVINRIGKDPYGDTLAEVINTTEYPFYDKRAHISAENEDLAREVLNAYYSLQDGLLVERYVPSSGVLVYFYGDLNRQIKILDRDGNVVWGDEN